MKDHRSAGPGVVITSGRTANSLGIVRCFGRRGIPVYLLELSRSHACRFSRYIRRRYRCLSAYLNPKAFLQQLIRLGAEFPDRPVLITTGDDEALAVAENRERLRPFYRFRVSSPKTVSTIVHKDEFYRQIETWGFPHPRTYFSGDSKEVACRIRDVPFPFLIKPSSTLDFVEAYGQKLFVVRNRRGLERALQKLSDASMPVNVQELVPAARHYEVYGYWEPDPPFEISCGWDRLRQMPPGFGTACFCRSVCRPEPKRLAGELFRAFNFEGPGSVEFVLDLRDGIYKIIEANARPSLQNRLAAACGVDIEYLIYQRLVGLEPDGLHDQTDGVEWVDNFKNAASILLAGEWTDAKVISQFLGSKVQSVADFRDPVPYLGEGLLCLYRAGQFARAQLKGKSKP